MDTEPRLLGGRYELAEVLGYGGMAEVFRGRDVRLGRDVAVKILRADLARDPAFLNRFRREAQAAASLNHPAIVSVYDTGEDDGTPYIVMEYVEGQTLRDLLQTEGRLLPRRALEIVAEVCGALEYSHRAGIVHRDIKPANVMLTRTGAVKVMDFGIARAVSGSTMTQTASVIGTAQYLSPEQARGEHVDARSDIYSTGCLLYELLTGVPPFQGDSPVAVAYQHVREDPAPPSSLDPELPGAVDAITMKALVKNPANRYQTAAEFRADLDRAIAGRRVEATPLLASQTTSVLPAVASTTVLLAPDPAERHRKRGIAYAILLLAVLAVFVGGALAAKTLLATKSSSVTVPNLLGLTLAQARQVLAQDHLALGHVTQAYIGQSNNSSPAGQIFDQSPIPSVADTSGSAVDVSVSQGVQQVTVPQVVGLLEPQAAALLTQNHLQVGQITTVDQAGSPAGQVLQASPAPGQVLNAGTSVNLTVVSGMVQLQDVRGQLIQDAENTLVQAGFSVQVVQKVDPAVPAGTVLAQSPAPGRVKAGITVTLTVAESPASPSPSPSGSPSPSPSPTPPTATPSP
ncbi:MAG: Stk1 family PASTA domain-containing Ser/Thr kinase [Mycobacteriales bacterium]